MTTLPQNLRPLDLIAKTARVTLKDTARVIHAFHAVTQFYGSEVVAPAELASGMCAERPSPDNIAACEQASFELREGQTPCRAGIDQSLQAIKAL